MRFESNFHINLGLLEKNVSLIKKITPGNQIIFMVKANAYGHGLEGISQFLVRNLGQGQLGVASLAEAIVLRKSMPDQKFDIFVFSDTNFFQENYLGLYTQYRISPVIGSIEALNIFIKNPNFKYVPLNIKINLGMNRLGLDEFEWQNVSELLKSGGRREIDHLMGHFSSANLISAPGDATSKHESHFKRAINYFKESGFSILHTSLSNSAAIEQKIGLNCTHVRPGLMLYGPSGLMPNLSSDPWQGKIVSSLKSYILQTRQMKNKSRVGYGLTPLSRDGLLVLVAMGYGDGISNRFQKVKIEQGPWVGEIVGRINMDMTAILFPVDCTLKAGDPFYFWRESTTDISSLSYQSQTIPYELFCQVSQRVPRIYSDGSLSEF